MEANHVPLEKRLFIQEFLTHSWGIHHFAHMKGKHQSHVSHVIKKKKRVNKLRNYFEL